MESNDSFHDYYSDYIENTYDCVDRIVFNAYYPIAQAGGGFRHWWRLLYGNDDNLDNNHLMRFAGRFSRRIRAYTKHNKIPLIECKRGERKHEIAEKYLPSDPNFVGVFCILYGRAPAVVRNVARYGKGGIDITKKTPLPYVYHYSFHIIDRQWGHIIIKLCPHPPFNAQIILNGHEYVAREAYQKKIVYTKEGNCFTSISNATDLAGIADTMRASSSVGRLVQVCEQWIYSACLCFALDLEEQEKTQFRYSYSVYQVEYSRNFLFQRGQNMEQIFHGIIDRTRGSLDIKRVKTIFGTKKRPHRLDAHGKKPRMEVVVEKPVYNLTVFKVHLGKLTVKMYSKGERVLRIEAIAHNTEDLHCGKRIDKFPIIISSLKNMVEHFLSVMNRVDVSLINNDILYQWCQPSQVGAVRVGGININSFRMRAVMQAVISLSPFSHGFTASTLSEKVSEIMKTPDSHYSPRQASYDLKKLRVKGLISKIGRTQRYTATPDGLRMMNGYIILREKVLIPFVSNAGKLKRGPKPKNSNSVDTHYENVQREMYKIFEIIGLAA